MAIVWLLRAAATSASRRVSSCVLNSVIGAMIAVTACW